MKIKNIMVVALFLICLLMISAVSAATDTEDILNSDVSSNTNSHYNNKDNNIAEKTSTSISKTEETPTERDSANEIKKVHKDNNSSKGVSTKTSGTFSELQTNITQTTDTISLTKNYSYDDEFSDDGITINKKISIHGNGYTLDAKNKCRIFNVINGAELIIDNLNLINGEQGNGFGGAIYLDGQSALTITNCIFNNNLALGGYGGAIYSENSPITVINCTFTHNRAAGRLDSAGGAIYSKSAKININNSLFNKNNDGCKGISVNNLESVVEHSAFVDDDYHGLNPIDSISCSDGRFASLCAKLYYGATRPLINLDTDYCYSDGDDDFKSGISITKNLTINGNGHTISGNNLARIFYIHDNFNLTLMNITLTNANVSDNDGGAVYISNNCTLKVTNCIFNNNYAHDRGGAIFNLGDNLIIINSTLTNNHALTGGSIYTTNNLIIENSNLSNNGARDGGAIANYESKTTLIKSNLTNNQANKGAAIYNHDSTLTLIETQLTNNKIYQYCGGRETEVNLEGNISFLTTQMFTMNIADVTEGETVKINLTTESDFNGEILVNITGDNFNEIISVEVKNGEGIGTIKNLPKGKYTASINTLYAEGFIENRNKDFTVSDKKSFTNQKIIKKESDDNLINNNKNTITKQNPKIKSKKTNKQTIKITAPSKTTFKAKTKPKKYTITLKNKNKVIKKATVKLTIKSKKYKVKTNNKGKATFKITNLKKKGKYTAIITYKRIKKTVKIIIK